MCFIRPHKSALIDPEALRVTGKTYDEIMAYPEASEQLPKFIAWLDSQQTLFSLLGQNIKFDRKFIYSLFCRNGMHGDFITRFRPNDQCTLKLAREIFKGKRNKPESFKLGDLCKFFKIPLNNAHDALADIEATYELYQNLRAIKPELKNNPPNLTYAEKRAKYLHSRYIQINPENDIFITADACKDPEAAKFIAEEIYHLYGE